VHELEDPHRWQLGRPTVYAAPRADWRPAAPGYAIARGMNSEPEILAVPEVRVACIPVDIPREQIRAVMGPGIQEIYATLAAQGVAPAGPWRCHHARQDPERFVFRICVPVASAVAPTGRVIAGTIPASRVVRTVYSGGYEGLGDAWGRFLAWVGAQGLATRADFWEIYALGPESSPDPAAWRTELVRPLAG
jgi:effector-binding domain-containing protein